jgi:hypothetical protein
MRREQRQNPASEPRQNRFAKMLRNQVVDWSGQQDLNLRPAVPKTVDSPAVE